MFLLEALRVEERRSLRHLVDVKSTNIFDLSCNIWAKFVSFLFARVEVFHRDQSSPVLILERLEHGLLPRLCFLLILQQRLLLLWVIALHPLH